MFVCGVLLAAFLATAVVSREIENKTVLTVVSKPIGRPAVVVGKYLGVAGAIVVAVTIMLVFLLFGIRHGVMSTAADELDMPVFVFGGGAVVISLFVGAWGNFFYGWSFSQATTLLLLPLVLVAYAIVLHVDDDWHVQSLGSTGYMYLDRIMSEGEFRLKYGDPATFPDAVPTTIWGDFKPQIMLACTALMFSMLVLTALATAVSTRLGQVMTIVVCTGVFVFGLLSNAFLGRYAFKNQAVAMVVDAESERLTREAFDEPGDVYDLKLDGEPDVPLPPGTPFYWGPNPNGFSLSVRPFTVPVSPEEAVGPRGPGRIVVQDWEGPDVSIVHAGETRAGVRRPPRDGDFVFTEPTRLNPVATALWATVPNMHYFWLVDAITQNQPVPFRHIGLLAVYSGLQVVGFLGLGVVLFQTRDVG